jgi:hypothetical protein
VIELWAVEAFVLRLLLFVSSSWLVLSVLEMQNVINPLETPFFSGYDVLAVLAESNNKKWDSKPCIQTEFHECQ